MLASVLVAVCRVDSIFAIGTIELTIESVIKRHQCGDLNEENRYRGAEGR